MKLLHVDSSILGAHSVSRQLTAEIVAEQTRRHPGLEIVHRDLAADPLPHLSPSHIAAMHGAEAPSLAEDLARGDAVIAEVMTADIIVIGAPMYNFGISSQLKSWIDRLLVAGKTFRYTASGAEGLVPAGKTVFIASARGGAYAAGTPMAALDHQERYLETALGFIGLRALTIIRAEGVAMGPDARAAAIAGALASIASDREAA